MIQDRHQYRVTKNKLKDLEQSLAELEKIKDTLHPRQFLGRSNSLRKTVSILQQEINDYESLRQQPVLIKITSIEELPLALIKARIAMGMTQKELAEVMGVKEQQIQRDESERYSSAGFYHIAEVASALGIQIQETNIVLQAESV